MNKIKNIVVSALSVVLVAALAITGTVAYLTSQDSDVNVMALGEVDIIQNEQERVDIKDAGNLNEDQIQEFEQNKPLYPYVDENLNQDIKDDFKDVIFPDGDTYELITGENAIDKFVSVTNTGKSDAYVRTWFAFEQGSLSADRFSKVIEKNINSDHWSWEDVATDVEIDGNKYVIVCATYLGSTENPTGILKPNETSYQSLLQVYMTSIATNEDCEAIDRNQNGTYEVLVYSQAVQTNNFKNATAALDEAFGDVVVANQPWGDGPIHYDGFVYNEEELLAALSEGTEIQLGCSFTIKDTIDVLGNTVIEGNGFTLSRADGFTGTMFQVDGSLTLNNITVDGGAVWSGEKDAVLGRGTTNTGVKALGNLIAANANASIYLNEGSVLQNNDGLHAVNLGTRAGATLTINGGEIIHNQSDSGAIWGGGNIVMEDGKINGNSSTGSAGAIRMVGNCNLTVNGGEINYNKAAGDGGAIWGYGTTIYNFNGGSMSGNEAVGTGGAIYTGTYSVINIANDFELCNNKARNSGAIRLTDHTSLNMTGGKVSGNTQDGASNAFNTWNNSIHISGGTLDDNISFVGGLGLTIGNADINGVIAYDLSTNHNTAYLDGDFKGFQFIVNEADEHFANFNFRPASEYIYAEGDENKLVCLNEGYVTYWDADKGVFALKAK